MKKNNNLFERKNNGEFEIVGSHKLLWEGKNTRFDVVKVNIDELKYNVLNGRIAELDLESDLDSRDAVVYKNIKNTIVKADKASIEKLGRDIGSSKLKTPLVVSRDGIILDGNRRYTAISMLLNGEIKPFKPTDVADLEFVEVVVLNSDATNKSIKLLEYSIQYDYSKKDYDPISRAFSFARDNKKFGIKVEEINEVTGISVADIEKDIRTVELIRIYLAAIGQKDDISFAISEKLDGPFKELSSKALTDYFKDHQKELVDVIVVAKQQGGDITRNVRDLVKGIGAKKQSIINSSEFKEKFEEVVEKVDVEKIIEKVNKAETREEKQRILSPTIAKQEIVNAALQTIKSDLTNQQINKSSSIFITSFYEKLKTVKVSGLSEDDKKILQDIKNLISRMI